MAGRWTASETQLQPDPRFGDPGLRPARTPGRIPDPMAATMAGWLADWRPGKREIDDYIGRFLTEPKPSVWFEAPARPATLVSWWPHAQRRGLRLDRRTRLAYRGARIFVNGESLAAPRAEAPLLRRFADARELPPDVLRATLVDSPLAHTLHQWFCAGWINFGR